SDTEVMLAAFEEWGLEAAVKRFVGMFAFALWDKHERLLHLVRDRIGKKPLYYGWSNREFLFGSELKAITAHPKFENEIDRGSVSLALRYGYIPAPWSIYRNIYKLMPGSILTVSPEQSLNPPADFSPFAADNGNAMRPECYWNMERALQAGIADPLPDNEE